MMQERGPEIQQSERSAIIESIHKMHPSAYVKPSQDPALFDPRLTEISKLQRAIKTYQYQGRIQLYSLSSKSGGQSIMAASVPELKLPELKKTKIQVNRKINSKREWSMDQLPSNAQSNSNSYYLADKNQTWKEKREEWIQSLGNCIQSDVIDYNQMYNKFFRDKVPKKQYSTLKSKSSNHQNEKKDQGQQQNTNEKEESQLKFTKHVLQNGTSQPQDSWYYENVNNPSSNVPKANNPQVVVEEQSKNLQQLLTPIAQQQKLPPPQLSLEELQFQQNYKIEKGSGRDTERSTGKDSRGQKRCGSEVVNIHKYEREENNRSQGRSINHQKQFLLNKDINNIQSINLRSPSSYILSPTSTNNMTYTSSTSFKDHLLSITTSPNSKMSRQQIFHHPDLHQVEETSADMSRMTSVNNLYPQSKQSQEKELTERIRKGSTYITHKGKEISITDQKQLNKSSMNSHEHQQQQLLADRFSFAHLKNKAFSKLPQAAQKSDQFIFRTCQIPVSMKY